MDAISYISVPELMDYMRDNGLVIVKATEVADAGQLRLRDLRRRLFRKSWLTFAEVLSLDLLPVKTPQGLQKWVDNESVIKKTEYRKDSAGRRYIHADALRRLGYTAEP